MGGTAPLAAAPTRFEVVKAGGEELEIAIAALRPCVTREQFTASLQRGDPAAAIELVHVDGGAGSPRGTSVVP